MINFISNDVGREYLVTCDKCGNQTREFVGYFKELIRTIKRDGWFIEYNGEWNHYCPNCSGKYFKKYKIKQGKSNV